LDQTLAAMVEQCDDFPEEMATELTVWQVKDMHRHYPNTDLSGDTAETDIWPRSRIPETNKKKIRRTMKHSRTTIRRSAPSVKSEQQRPILRPSLYDALVARMTTLMEKCLSWQ
jgi:hypothetical protein